MVDSHSLRAPLCHRSITFGRLNLWRHRCRNLSARHRSTIVIGSTMDVCDAKQFEARLLSGLCAAGMAALAPQLGLLTFFLTVLAAVFAPWSAFGDYTGAGGMRAFLGVRHLTPPGAGVILLTFRCSASSTCIAHQRSNRTDEFGASYRGSRRHPARPIASLQLCAGEQHAFGALTILKRRNA